MWSKTEYRDIKVFDTLVERLGWGGVGWPCVHCWLRHWSWWSCAGHIGSPQQVQTIRRQAESVGDFLGDFPLDEMRDVRPKR